MNNHSTRVIVLSVSVLEAVSVSSVLGFLILCTLVGNLLVVLSVFTYPPLRQGVQNYLLVSLAAADMSVAISVLPLNVLTQLFHSWHWGRVLCEMWLTCDIFFCTASILHLCGIALERYLAVRYPIAYAYRRNTQTVLAMIAVIYGLSAVISIPPLFGWRRPVNDSQKCHLTEEKSFVVYSACGSFFIPSVVMIVVYLNVFRVARARLRVRAKRETMRREMTHVKTLLTSPSILEPQPVSSTAAEDKNGDSSEVATGLVTVSTNAPPTKRHSSPDVTPVHPISAHHNNNYAVKTFLQNKQKISLTRERKAARTLGIILGVYILCWLPFFLMYVVGPFCEQCKQLISPRLETGITWLGYVNSCLNPVLYTIFNMDFRRAFKRLLHFK